MSAFTEANRKAFNDLSDSYSSFQWQRDLSNQVAEALQARKDWFGVAWADAEASTSRPREVRLLDYACGTGAITRALGSYVTTIRGIDISEGMVAKYNEAAASSGLTPDQAHAVVGDVCASSAPADALGGPELRDFDIAVIGLGFHHFEDPARAVTRLAERLKPDTGVLVIVDFLPFDAVHDMRPTIKHHGFTGEQMRDLYRAAGLEDFDIVALARPAVMELKTGRVERTLFVAKGRRVGSAWQRFSKWVGGMQDLAAGQFSYGSDGQTWDQGLARGKQWDGGLSKDGES